MFVVHVPTAEQVMTVVLLVDRNPFSHEIWIVVGNDAATGADPDTNR